MYDNGTMLQRFQRGPRRLGEGHAQPRRFRLGLDAGTVVKVIRVEELMAPLAADFGVPAGSAMIPANAPGSNANTLIDASASVTDVRWNVQDVAQTRSMPATGSVMR